MKLGVDLSDLPSIITERLRGRSEDPEKRLKIGRYLVLGELGHGGMGLVYEAWDPHIERFVAIKTIEPELVPDPAQREETIRRFLRETKVVGRLRHPGIITIFDYGHEPESLTKTDIYCPGCVYYYVMELLDGQTLGNMLRRDGALADRVAVAITKDIAEALALAHESGIIHRDIKPSNIFVRENGQAVLLDFGIAKTDSATLTRQGQILGTPSYLAPERLQEKSQDVDGRVDQFSLGVLMYTMLTGERPFNGTSVKEVLDSIAGKAHRRLKRDSRAGRELSTVLDKMLAKSPDDRYENMVPVARKLDEIARLFAAEQKDELVFAVTPAAVPVHAPMEQLATEVAQPKSPLEKVRVGELLRQEGTRPDAALQRQTRQIQRSEFSAPDGDGVTAQHQVYEKEGGENEPTFVNATVPAEKARGPVPSQRYGSLSEDETVAETDGHALEASVEVTDIKAAGGPGQTRPRRSNVQASNASEEDVIVKQAALNEDTPHDVVPNEYLSHQQTEQVRARPFDSDATEIVRARKKKAPATDLSARRAATKDPAEKGVTHGVLPPLPSAAVARKTFGVGKGENPSRKRPQKRPTANIKIHSTNLGRSQLEQRKLQNRIAILLGAVLFAIAIGLLLGRKRLRNQVTVEPVEQALVQPTARNPEGVSVRPEAEKPRLIAPRTPASLLKDGQGALAKGELDRAKSLFVRARTSSGGDKTLFEKATLGELQVALLLKDRRLANSLLRDLEAHSASPAIVARAKELIGTQANSLKSKTSSKRKTKSNPKASCKEIALRYLNYPMEGVKALENLSRSEPRNACVQKQLGVFYARLNQPGDALAAYERYLKINPRAPDRAAVRRKTKSLKRLLGVDRK